jgi:NADPH:quinone reductase-like Zn-dependent oxidoreductase
MTSKRMQKIEVAAPGGLDRLRLTEAAPPAPGPEEVAIRVHSFGLNFADVAIRMGLYDAVKDYPMSPGFECAGEVIECGAEVKNLRPGDQVFAALRFGAYAEVAIAAERLVWRRPTRLSVEEAAGFPTALATAVHGIEHLAHARPGERILVHSAAGGVGLMAVQLAKRLGLKVTGLVGRRAKVELAREFGADEVLAREDGDLDARLRALPPFDVIMDASGGPGLRTSYALLAPMGRLVVFGAATMLDPGRARANWLKLAWRFVRTPRFMPLDLVMRNRSVMGFNLVHLFESAELAARMHRRIEELAGADDFRPLPTTSIPAREIARAHETLQSGQSTGKLVLSW